MLSSGGAVTAKVTGQLSVPRGFPKSLEPHDKPAAGRRGVFISGLLKLVSERKSDTEVESGGAGNRTQAP